MCAAIPTGSNSLLQSIWDRQIGRWPLKALYYDSFLKRLVVSKYDSYLGVSPNMQRRDYNPCPPLFACRFAETKGYEHYVGLANEDGRVAIQNTFEPDKEDSEHSAFDGFPCHSNAVFDLVWTPGTMSFVTVSGDHSAKLWSMTSGSIEHVQDFLGHTRTVRTAAFFPDNPYVFATGGRDGKILIWDTRVSGSASSIVKPENCIDNCHPYNYPKTPSSGSKKHKFGDKIVNSITGLVFKDEHTLISCSSGEGSIRVWDTRRNYANFKRDPLPMHSISYCGSSSKNGYSSLILDKSRIKLYANCVDNVIYCFNVSTYNVLPIQKFVGHENSSSYIKSSLSPDSNFLISGSIDQNAYIWNVKFRDPIVKLAGHEAEVTCATWCQVGDIKIVTCSDDSKHKIWRIGKEELSTDEVKQLYGQAHELPPTERVKLPWDSIDKTPQASKRKNSYTKSSSKKKLCTPENLDAPSCSNITRKSKRSLFDMMNGSALKPINEEDAKRPRIDSEADAPLVQNVLQEISENTLPSNDYGYSTPVKGCSTSNTSPRPYYAESSEVMSPTMNLPNFVTDGKAPHLRLSSPVTSKGTLDWLTKIRREKRMGDENKPIPKSTDVRSPVPEKRKQSMTLLDYFTLDAKRKKT